MNAELRQIRNWHSTSVLRKLISSLFAAEIISPSEELWVVSPWISDISILDNSAGEFSAIVPSWDYSKISLSKVISYLSEQGTAVYIITRNDEWSQSFLRAVGGKANVCSREDKFIHEKGVLARHDFYLEGSFNFTFSGVTLNKEKANLHTDLTTVSENRIHYYDWWVHNAYD